MKNEIIPAFQAPFGGWGACLPSGTYVVKVGTETAKVTKR